MIISFLPAKINLSQELIKKSKKVTVQLRVLFNDDHAPKIRICFNPTNLPLKSNTALRKMGISSRETDIIHLLAEGKKNSEIASALFISEYTVAASCNRIRVNSITG